MQEPATEDGGVRSTLEAQVAVMCAKLAALPTSRQVQPARPADTKPRVPSGLPKSKGKYGEDVRHWLFQVETLCSIHGHDGDGDNTTHPSIAGAAMEDPASGWFLFWASENLWRNRLGRSSLKMLLRISKPPTTKPCCARSFVSYAKLTISGTAMATRDPSLRKPAEHDDAKRGNGPSCQIKFLLDCGATTVYVSRGFVNNHKLKAHVVPGRIIRVKRGDNAIVEAVLELAKIEVRLKGVPKYRCVVVVFNTPDEFDCILGMPFFVDVQPNIDWKHECFMNDDSGGASAIDNSTSCGKCSQVNGSGLHDAVDSDSSTTKSRHSCQAAVPETQSECKVKTAERPAAGVKNRSRSEKNAQVEAMFTLGVVDSEGVETKYITRKKLRKFRRLPAKDQPEHDFMVVLRNDTIKAIDHDIKRNDEPDNVESKKIKRFLQTDWDSFKTNPALPVLTDYKESVFMPELPDGLPMK
ncbi:unnamed protein product [Phytophthora fragariaefolia]|uniref:Unnamed protein product n=1 Tax=Phytophthora fragariaefolia TaxID=1490495 RepID=A0A9W6XU69_9STRA|nr:unnamed protein product [Phytophthora fragariaefolia]